MSGKTIESSPGSFTPGPDCFNERTCAECDFCMQAHILNQEIGYKEVGRPDNVAGQLAGSSCQHPDAEAAREAARNILNL